ncbi:MAG: MFS transporter [Sphingobium sp.]|jgi:MFS family permease
MAADGRRDAPPDPAYPRPVLAWGIVAALFVAYIFSFIDRMIIGLLVEPIKADLGLSDTQISLLQGMAFALFFTIAGLPIGRLIDRAPRMKVVAAGIALWSLMTALCGTVTSYWQFFVARMGVGVGEAVLSPAAYSIISDSFPRRRLGLAMGVYGLGSAIGAGLAFMIGAVVITLVARAGDVAVPLIGTLKPWQFAFVCAGLPGVLVALIFLLLPEPPRGDDAGGASAAPPPIREVVDHVGRNGGLFWSIFIGVSAVNFSVLGSVSWLPAMLMRAFGMEMHDAGYLAGGLLILGGLIGMIGGGLLMDRYGGGAPGARMRFCAWATAAGTLGAAAFPLVPSIGGFAIAFVLFFSAAAVTVGAAPSTLQQLTPNRMRATVSAAYVFVINLVGLGLGPTATALLGDTLFPFESGIRYAIAIVAPLGYLIAALFFWRAARLASHAGHSTQAASGLYA